MSVDNLLTEKTLLDRTHRIVTITSSILLKASAFSKRLRSRLVRFADIIETEMNHILCGFT